jgi:hypothetical protein
VWVFYSYVRLSRRSHTCVLPPPLPAGEMPAGFGMPGGMPPVGRCTLTPPDPQLKDARYPGGFNP